MSTRYITDISDGCILRALTQDDDFLKNRDYSAPTESTVDLSLLPKVMQKRNFRKMSQTKYTHLADQDTSAPRTSRPGGGFGGGGGGKMECFRCGGDHMKKGAPTASLPCSSLVRPYR
jgi:microfibrillar-associated protein 1